MWNLISENKLINTKNIGKLHNDEEKTYQNDTKEANGQLSEKSSINHVVNNIVIINNKVKNPLFYIIISLIITLLLIITISFTPWMMEDFSPNYPLAS